MNKTKTSIALITMLISSYVSSTALPSYANTSSHSGAASGMISLMENQGGATSEGNSGSTAETDARTAWINAVASKLTDGDYEGALKDCNEAIDKDKKDSVAYYLRAVTKYYLLEPLPVAIEDLDSAIAWNSEFSEAFLLRGSFLMRMNDVRKAVKDFDKVVALHPDNLNAISMRIDAHELLKDYSGLVDDYTLLTALYPDNPGIYYRRALAKEKLNDKTGALADLKKAEELVIAQKDEEGIKIIQEKIASLEQGTPTS